MWAEVDGSRCRGCGTSIDESFAAENFGLYDAHPLVCHACAAIEDAQENWSGSTKGLRWSVTK